MIETATELADLRARVAGWKRAGLRVGLVPTMGNLHPGHHSLVKLARASADRVVASVFVNPTQFGPNEDFARYPRTPQADAAGLDAAGADLMWLPSVETMYPYGHEAAVRVRVPVVTEVLEGAHRPGHFDGVCTVVARLFNQVQPDMAVFGRKDYQQFAVIRYLVRDLGYPIELVAAPILREADGLAMSSRNQYLTATERPVAAELQRCLQAMRDASQAGVPRAQVEAEAARRLEAAGFQVDYAVVRRPDLVEPELDRVDSVHLEPGLPQRGSAGSEVGRTGPQEWVALVAARLGRTRLIDNLEFSA